MKIMLKRDLQCAGPNNAQCAVPNILLVLVPYRSFNICLFSRNQHNN